MQYVNFLWPPMVAAPYRKRFARALHSSESYWLQKYPFSQDSVVSIKSYHSLSTVQKTISYQNSLCYENQGGSRVKA